MFKPKAGYIWVQQDKDLFSTDFDKIFIKMLSLNYYFLICLSFDVYFPLTRICVYIKNSYYTSRIVISSLTG